MNTTSFEEENKPQIPKTKMEEKKETFFDLIKFALLALVIIVPIRTFIAQPFIVSGASMVPTFEDRDYLIVDELSYRLSEPHRGDVVIMRFPEDKKRFFIKRIVGLPNETISVAKSQTTITNAEHPQGMILDESYVKNKSDQQASVTLGSDEYFVMGDNRSGSFDSRSWGPLKRNLIIGRPLVRLLPVKHIKGLPGKHEFTN